MKNALVLLLATAFAAQAATVRFNISPPGSDVAVGLSPSNTVPAVTNSTGTGDAISGGIVFDTASQTLQLAIGYGSAAGFSDLTGEATAAGIYGPASPGQNGAVLFDLSPYVFPAPDPAKGGVFFGTILYPSNEVAGLLAGSNYVSILTATNPAGEIRGQLIPVVVSNEPPTVTCPPASTVECGAPASLSVAVFDPEGDALTVAWSVNGVVAQMNHVPASSPPAVASVSFSAVLPLGTNTVGVTVTDTATNTASCSTMVAVVDTTPPVIESVTATPDTLWPPNHKWVNVEVNAVVTDTCGSATWKIISVTSNEAVKGRGDGHTSPDWVITGDHTVKLRAERSGKGNGRNYTITVQATDDSGNVSTPESVTVSVPKSQGKGKKK
jgi:hypothetical protein